jgi:hypothetical protein
VREKKEENKIDQQNKEVKEKELSCEMLVEDKEW